MALVRVTFASKNFQSNLSINFKIYDRNDILLYNTTTMEWAGTGVYFNEYDLTFRKNGDDIYLAIAEEPISGWKGAKLITAQDAV